MPFKLQRLRIVNLMAAFYAALSVVVVIAVLSLTITSYESSKEFSKMSMFQIDCSCIYAGEQYDFCYHLPSNATVSGLPFNCEYARYLEKLGLLHNKNVVNLELQHLPEPVFVTAFSDNHYHEGLTLITNIRKLWPQHKLYIYDLGLRNESAVKLRGMCMQELRRFPFENYPAHVAILQEYRWKPLIIAETLNEFGAVWYMDTSIRWNKNSLNDVYRGLECRKNQTRGVSTNAYDNITTIQCKKSGYLLQLAADHGTYPATHPGMYRFFPTLIEQLKKSQTYAAGFIFAVRTADTLEIMKWDILCALEKYCMAPPGARLSCNFASDRYTVYAHCHRYDQSAINVLLANAYDYNIKNYITNIEEDGAATIFRQADYTISEKDIICEKEQTL